MSRTGGLRRWSRVALKILFGLVAGVCLLLALALISLNFAPVRGLITEQTNRAMESMFRGRLTVAKLGHVDLTGVRGVDLEIHDAAGKLVVRVRDAEVSMRWPRLVYDAIRGGTEPLLVHVRRAAVSELEVWLLDDGTGTPTLAQAFEPRKPSPDSGGPGTRVVVDEIAVASSKIRGELSGPGPIEVDLLRLRANLENDARGTQIGVPGVDIDARRVPELDRVRGHLDARAFLAPTPEKLRVSAALDAELAGSKCAISATLAGQQLSAKLEIPSLSQATIRRFAPELSVQEPVSLKADVSGPLDDLGFALEVLQRQTEVRAKGRFRNAKPPELRARVEASRVNLGQILAAGPRTELTLEADAELRFGEQGLEGELRARTSPDSRFESYVLPAAALQAKLALPKSGATTAEGTLEVAEPGAETRAEFTLRSDPAGAVVEVRSRSALRNAPRVAALTGGLHVSGPLEIIGKYDTGADRIEALVRLSARDVRHPAARVARLELEAAAHGTTKAPRLAAKVSASDVTVSERSFRHVVFDANGTAERLAVRAKVSGKNPDSVEVEALVLPTGPSIVRDVVARIHNRDTKLELRADSVTSSAGRLAVEGVTLDGAGHAEASLVYGRTLERFELSASELEPVKALTVFGIEAPVRDARVDLEASFSSRGRSQEGKLTGKVRRVTLGKLQNGTADVELELAQGKLTGNLAVALGAGANARITMQDLATNGPITGAPDLRGMTGTVSMLGDVDLKRIAPLFPIAGIERATGRVRFDGAFESRRDGGGPPKARMAVTSHKLLLVGQRKDSGNAHDPVVARDTAPWTLRGIDVNVDTQIDERGGRIDGRLFDEHGTLVALSAKMAALALSPERLERAALLRNPFEVTIHVPGRALERLPTPIRPNDLRGAVAFDLRATGTLSDPKVELLGTLAHFGPVSERDDPRGLGVFVEARYSRAEGTLRAEADGRRGRVLALDSRWQGDLAAFGEATAAHSPVRGALTADITDFPLAVIPILRDRQVRGRVSGRARLEGLGTDAKLSLELETRRLKVEQLVLDRLKARITTANDRLELETTIDGGGGSAGAKVSTGLAWGKRLVPELDQNLEGSLFAKNLRLSALSPLVAGSVSELDGRLNARFSAKIVGGKPEVVGRASLNGGVVQLPTLGQRFHGLQATVEVTPGRLRIPELRARGLSGGFRASAEARLDGVVPVAFDGQLEIDRDDKLPLSIEGESVGEVWGKIEARYRRDARARETNVQVDVKRLHVELPELAPQGIQDLAQDERIRVGYRRRDGVFTAIPLQPIEEESATGPAEKTVISVNLGEVSIEKGQQADVTLSGRVQATLGDELDVRGRIETRRGSLDISGKKFEIERGSVSFTGGEPDNPTISAVARYDSPAGYTVYAEYTGTAKAGKLRLSSDPQLSQDEILTLLLFGTPEGSFGAGNGDSLSTAVSVAGGTAAQGLNRALANVTDLDVQARIDTSTGAPRPELVIQLTPRVAARVTQALGEPGPGQSPDRTFLTVEFRFARSWSLSTMVGDKGASAVDLIWRTRY